MLSTRQKAAIQDAVDRVHRAFPERSPKRRLFRTNNIAHELRKLGKPFEWFTKNSIVLRLPKDDCIFRKRALFITGSLTCYKIRLDEQRLISEGDFKLWELPDVTGRSLLLSLVRMGLLDESYRPEIEIPKYQRALMNEL